MHCRYDKLTDLAPIFKSVREWPGIQEKSHGIFYFKSMPFLHFHEKDGLRWADVRNGKGWSEIGISFDANQAARAEFRRKLRAGYDRIAKYVAAK